MISSLQALRKITKPNDSSSTPIEGFQKYLESEKYSPSVSQFKKGLSLSKIKNLLLKTNRKRKYQCLMFWKIESIKEEIHSDHNFIKNQITGVLRNGIQALNKYLKKVQSHSFCLWKHKNTVFTPYHLIFLLRTIFYARFAYGFSKIRARHHEKTKLVFFIINSLTKIIRKKFLRWKINTNRIVTEVLIQNKIAIINFKEFQKFKLTELVMNYRKVRELIIKRFYFRWKEYQKEEEGKDNNKEIKEEKETRRLKKLQKQKEKHENANQEAIIKENILDMMIQLLNVSK